MADALKLQWAIDSPGTFDRTGGEPKEDHGTLKFPGADHGIEIDPATPEQVAIAEQVHALMQQLPFKQKVGGHTVSIELRKMDSDNRV